MRKPTDWAKVRAAYEVGDAVIRLAQVFNVKASAIHERAAEEGWGPNAGEEQARVAKELKREAQQRRISAAGAIGALPQEKREALALDLLTRYLKGETPEQMSRETGASKAALYYFLFGGLDDVAHWSLITQALTARMAHADEMLETAEGSIEISRAREMARFYRMDFERRRPHLYGQQSRLEVVAPIEDLGERLRRSRARIIDQEPAMLPAAADVAGGLIDLVPGEAGKA